jgi:uncharacterized protein YraI
MRFTSGLVCLGALAISATCAAAKPAYVLSTVNLRAAPGTTNEIIAKIPAGSLVDTASCTEGWCEVTWQDKTGFAIQTALDMSGRVPQRRPGPPSGYEVVPGPGYIVEEAPVYYGYGPYYGPRRYWRHHWRRW